MGDSRLTGDNYVWDNPRLTEGDVAALNRGLAPYMVGDDPRGEQGRIPQKGEPWEPQADAQAGTASQAEGSSDAETEGVIPGVGALTRMSKGALDALVTRSGVYVKSTGSGGATLKQDLINALNAARN